ncbi:hypothetical protein VBG40_11510 [Vagococcus fluvialis]|uniref:hypothetical protein n=1 Tax=Vagococcus fluvialis TaxID=2738 RepID=UPI0037A8B5FC
MTKEKNKVKRELSVLKKCFFITPIGDSKSNEFEKLEGLIENVLNPVLEEKNYEIIVAHKIQSLGSINDQIFKNIIDSDLIISNLTGLNANVMYETAVAHSFGKPTIMISENGTVLPFDLKADRTIFFSDSIKGTGLLKKDILSKITQLESDANTDNPIVRVIQSSKLNEQLNKENLSEDETLMKLILNLTDKVDDLYSNKNNYFKNHEYSLEENDRLSSLKRNQFREVNVFAKYLGKDDKDITSILNDIDKKSYGNIHLIQVTVDSIDGNECIFTLRTNLTVVNLLDVLNYEYQEVEFIAMG